MSTENIFKIIAMKQLVHYWAKHIHLNLHIKHIIKCILVYVHKVYIQIYNKRWQ